MNPVLDYLSTVRRYGVEPRYAARGALYLLKAIAWEPFRLAERAIDAVRDEPGRPFGLPKQPLFILGYYRSGTTHLQETLLEDPDLGYMNFFHCFFPTAFTITEPLLKPICERIVRAIGMTHPAHGIPFSFELPAEEDVSMIASGFRHAANWGQTYPRFFKEIYGKMSLLDGISPDEERALKEHLGDLFWRVSRSNGHKRLLLKSPPQLSRVRLLTEMYPDAKYVFIRRHPYDVFASNKKLWKSFEKTQLQDIDEESIREYILWSHHESHLAYERDKALFAPGQLCEISYEEFRARPLPILRNVYETLSLGEFSRVEPIFARYLARTHQSSQPPYRFTDVERRAIETRLGHWIDAWGYRSPEAHVAA